MATTFAYDDKQWEIGNVPVLDAWNIARRALPIIKTAGAVIMDPRTQELFKSGTEAEKAEEASVESFLASPTRLISMLEQVGPLLDGLANLPDEQMDYIVMGCLAQVKVQSNGAWSSVYNKHAKRFQFTVDQGDMLVLVVRVLMEIVPGFLGKKGA